MSSLPNERLPWYTKIAYGSADFGFAFVDSCVAVLFAIFLTDMVGLPAKMAALAIFIGKSWDYINDPIIGYLVDRTRTRWGRPRQKYFERRAFSDFADDLNRPSMGLDDSMHHGEPQAGALARFLGREIGVKDPRLNSRIHSMPRVRNRQQHVIALLKRGIRGSVLFGDGNVAEADFEESSLLFHGMGRIRAKVHQNLLHLGGVRQGGPCIRRDEMLQLNGGGQRCSQKAKGFLDHRL